MKKFINFVTDRSVTVSIAILLQLLVLIIIMLRFDSYSSSFHGIMFFLSAIVVIWILNSKRNPAYKIAWIIPILIAPLFGSIFYWLFGNNGLNKKEKLKMKSIETKSIENIKPNQHVISEIKAFNPNAAAQSRYIRDFAHSPPYKNTSTTYYPLGEDFFKALKEELLKAEHYIFMEYFIIQEGVMWNEILDLLVQKAQSGVEVRLIYDDIGCIHTLPVDYPKKLESLGIHTTVFNPFKPKVSPKFNNRDHRKITVIDGIVGFTGGCNLADEYINAIVRFGHWKDSAIKIQGDAVWSLTVMFLSLWNFIKGTNEDYNRFIPSVTPEFNDGYVQPFTDNPLDNEPVGSSIYLNLIFKAQRYVYIKTPYLIIDNETFTALSIAAKSGVDVRIITPGCPDKWYAHATTRSYYQMLIENGVKIYEYTPGFIHEKSFVADDEYGVTGTVNLDYRSLYLHFECGVWLFRTASIKHMRDDFLSLLAVCKPIRLDTCRKISCFRKWGRSILRFFAPLM